MIKHKSLKLESRHREQNHNNKLVHIHNHKKSNIEVINQYARRDINSYRFTSSLKLQHNKGLRVCPEDDIITVHLKARKVTLAIKNLYQKRMGRMMHYPGPPVVEAEEKMHHLSTATDLGDQAYFRPLEKNPQPPMKIKIRRDMQKIKKQNQTKGSLPGNSEVYRQSSDIIVIGTSWNKTHQRRSCSFEFHRQ